MATVTAADRPLLDLDRKQVEIAHGMPSGWAELVSKGSWKPARHLDLVEEEVLRCIATGGRLAIMGPPRHGKSWFILRFLVAWYLGRFPNKRVLACSHGLRLAKRFTRLARRDFERCGREVFGLTVDSASGAADQWDVAGHDGGVLALGVGGHPSGESADLLIGDDLVSGAEAALSEVQRENLWEWWLGEAYRRMEPGAAAILFMARWHDDDLMARVLKNEPERWRVLRLPALAEDDDPLGRVRGEALWPERWPRSELEWTRDHTPAYWWSALYQGSPSPEGGGIWRPSWWKDRRFDRAGTKFTAHGETWDLTDFEQRFTIVDLATSTRTSADYTVFSSFGIRRGRLYLFDVVRERMEGPAILTRLDATMKEWGCSVAWVEDSGFQLSIIQDAARRGMAVRTWGRKLDAGFRVEGDKVALAYSATPYVEQGRVYLPTRAPWLADCEHELATFPGAHDDFADTFAVGVRVGCIGPPPSMFTGDPMPGDKPDPYADPDPGEDEGPTWESRREPVAPKPWHRGR